MKTRKLITLFCLLLCLSAYSCMSNKSYSVIRGIYENKDSIACVRGRVIDLSTSETMIGALIKIESREISTDVEGEYSIKGVSSGRMKIEVFYIGYYAVEKELNIEGNTIIELDFILSPVELSDDLGVD